MRRWYVAHTQPNSETKAIFNLSRQGFTSYLPRFHARRRHARKVESVIRPLFPCYLFVYLNMEHDRWRSVNGTYGVKSLIANGDRPLPVPVGVVESFKAREDKLGVISLQNPTFYCGQRVEILEGPMKMRAGYFRRMSGEERVLLLLDLLGREVDVTIPLSSVAAA